MPRGSRLVIPGLPHHVTHRGNNGQDIFHDFEDYSSYLGLLKKHALSYGLIVNGYCLMTNHVHLIVTPGSEKSLSEAVGKAHGHYSQYSNKVRDATGHVWENRFYSFPMDHNHFINTLKYIERNPVRAGVVGYPWDYKWSSAGAHVGAEDKWGVVDLVGWSEFIEKTGLNWKDWLMVPLAGEITETIRQYTNSGKYMTEQRGQAPDFAVG